MRLLTSLHLGVDHPPILISYSSKMPSQASRMPSPKLSLNGGSESVPFSTRSWSEMWSFFRVAPNVAWLIALIVPFFRGTRIGQVRLFQHDCFYMNAVPKDVNWVLYHFKLQGLYVGRSLHYCGGLFECSALSPHSWGCCFPSQLHWTGLDHPTI